MKKTLLAITAVGAMTLTLPLTLTAFAADGQPAASTPTPQASATPVCNAPTTRAGLQRELAALEAAGYSPVGNDNSYPANLQRAARIASTQSPQCVNG